MNQDILVIIEHIHGQVANISYELLAAGRELAGNSGGQLIALFLGHNQQDSAASFAADTVWYTDHPSLAEFLPDAYLQVLAGQIQQADPRAILLGHTSIGMDLASGLSARLDLPLVTQCKRFDLANGTPKFVCQICGGKIMAEGFFPEPTTLLTMIPGSFSVEIGQATAAPPIHQQAASGLDNIHTNLLRYIEPDPGDVDITKESILIAVGRGLQNQDDLELVEELAEALGGQVCGSRPMIDQGWLPTSRLIGKSGLIVQPDLYLALGISGAPEHVEGMAGSRMIVAINTDPRAPIFNVAQLGAEVDLLDLVEELTEQLNLAPVG